MSLVETLGPHLPFLRRYARALTGSQPSGDAYIRAAFEVIAADPSGVDASLSPKLALYKAVHGIWMTTGAQLETGEAGTRGPEARLAQLAPVHRQAFLLTSLEGFSLSDTALILDLDTEKTQALVDQALGELEAELATRVLIIEDEPIIAADLESIVEELGHSVTGNATTQDEARQMVADEVPGLVLCDIQLADNSSGIDAANEILSAHDVPIIFITAFPERLLTGERPEPTYLISKPFQENHVKAVIAQALFFHPSRTSVAA